MKQKWQELEKREQLLISIAGFLGLLFILYRVIWLPVFEQGNSIQKKILAEEALYYWMKPTVEKILQAKQHDNQGNYSKGMLLPQVQLSLRDSSINKDLTKISMGSEHQVNMTFESVSFDDLISWLEKMNNEKGITVVSLNSRKLEKPGLAYITLQLQ